MSAVVFNEEVIIVIIQKKSQMCQNSALNKLIKILIKTLNKKKNINYICVTINK